MRTGAASTPDRLKAPHDRLPGREVGREFPPGSRPGRSRAAASRRDTHPAAGRSPQGPTDRSAQGRAPLSLRASVGSTEASKNLVERFGRIDTDAPSGVASGRLGVGSALMLPHLPSAGTIPSRARGFHEQARRHACDSGHVKKNAPKTDADLQPGRVPTGRSSGLPGPAGRNLATRRLSGFEGVSVAFRQRGDCQNLGLNPECMSWPDPPLAPPASGATLPKAAT
jgi:hypothetical protein